MNRAGARVVAGVVAWVEVSRGTFSAFTSWSIRGAVVLVIAGRDTASCTIAFSCVITFLRME
jgi:hypothetical protein